jgi:hypothetical protein
MEKVQPSYSERGFHEKLLVKSMSNAFLMCLCSTGGNKREGCINMV